MNPWFENKSEKYRERKKEEFEEEPELKRNKGNERFRKLIENYRKLGSKEFFKRWAQGIESISPLRQTKSNLLADVLIIAGLIFGIVIMWGDELWWVGYLILPGSLLLSLNQFLGHLQKYIRLKAQNKLMKIASLG